MPRTTKSGPKRTELFTTLARTVRKYSTPGEADRIIADRMEKLRKYYGGDEKAYVESLIAYDCWAEKDHGLTGPAFSNRKERAALWEEIIRDYGKPDKTGSFFEHRVEEMMRSRTL